MVSLLAYDDHFLFIDNIARKQMYTMETSSLPPQRILVIDDDPTLLAAVTEGLDKLKIRVSDLNNRIILGGTEALKNFLLNDTCLGFLPLRSVIKQLKTGELVRLSIPGLRITREFYFVQRQGSENDKINNLFIKLALQQYNKKL